MLSKAEKKTKNLKRGVCSVCVLKEEVIVVVLLRLTIVFSSCDSFTQ